MNDLDRVRRKIDSQQAGWRAHHNAKLQERMTPKPSGMRQIAVIGDGTAAHEEFVYIVSANDESDALMRVANHILNQEDDDAVQMGGIENHCSPTYEVDLLNSDGSTVYTLHTAPIVTGRALLEV